VIPIYAHISIPDGYGSWKIFEVFEEIDYICGVAAAMSRSCSQDKLSDVLAVA
jgi:hypothetical protein